MICFADGDWQIPNDVKKYAFFELAKATDNFSAAHEIGAGGFGKVFCGTFDDGKMVAIKRAKDESGQGKYIVLLVVEFNTVLLTNTVQIHNFVLQFVNCCKFLALKKAWNYVAKCFES
jgi:hypothetical protein